MINELIYKACMAYLIGSIPFSVIISKYFLKKDIRTVGSGNIGVSNAYRAGGFLFSFSIAVFDISKAVIVLNYILPGSMGMFFVCAGQMLPITLGFKGGKGVACYIGSIIANNPIVGVILAIGWMLTTKITKTPFIASVLLIIASIPFLEIDKYVLATILLIIIRHKSNIIGLLEKFSKNKQ